MANSEYCSRHAKQAAARKSPQKKKPSPVNTREEYDLEDLEKQEDAFIRQLMEEYPEEEKT